MSTNLVIETPSGSAGSKRSASSHDTTPNKKRKPETKTKRVCYDQQTLTDLFNIITRLGLTHYSHILLKLLEAKNKNTIWEEHNKQICKILSIKSKTVAGMYLETPKRKLPETVSIHYDEKLDQIHLTTRNVINKYPTVHGMIFYNDDIEQTELVIKTPRLMCTTLI